MRKEFHLSKFIVSIFGIGLLVIVCLSVGRIKRVLDKAEAHFSHCEKCKAEGKP